MKHCKKKKYNCVRRLLVKHISFLKKITKDDEYLKYILI